MATQTLETPMPEQTIFGCPLASYQSFASVCSVTGGPACASSTQSYYDAACCGSLTSYALRVGSCVATQAPACLQTAIVNVYLSDITNSSTNNPCAQFASPMTSAAATLTSASSAAVSASSTATAAGSSSSSSAAAAAGSSSTSVAATTGSAASASSSSATASTVSASATPKSDAPKVGAGFKVYVTVAMLGALAVLAM